MPYNKGAYSLPDLTWERAYVPCRDFEVSPTGFVCNDTKLGELWTENAQWDITGKAINHWMPNLRRIPFKIKGNYLILSPEYK